MIWNLSNIGCCAAISQAIKGYVNINRAYVVNSGSNNVSVINTLNNTVVGSPIAVGNSPQQATITPNNSTVYVTNNSSNTVSVIDTSLNTVIKTINVSTSPMSIICNNAGTYVYVITPAGSINIIDTSSNTVINTITLGAGYNLQRAVVALNDSKLYIADNNSSGVVVVNLSNSSHYYIDFGFGFTDGVIQSTGIAISYDGTKIYVIGAADSQYWQDYIGGWTVMNTATEIFTNYFLGGYEGALAGGNEATYTGDIIVDHTNTNAYYNTGGSYTIIGELVLATNALSFAPSAGYATGLCINATDTTVYTSQNNGTAALLNISSNTYAYINGLGSAPSCIILSK